jgi:hypothetical protein
MKGHDSLEASGSWSDTLTHSSLNDRAGSFAYNLSWFLGFPVKGPVRQDASI